MTWTHIKRLIYIDVLVADENVWLTQDMIATLYEKARTTITEHLKNIFDEGELDENSTCRKFRRVASNGKEYNTKFYNLEAVIAVSFRANLDRAIQFRQWATTVLKDFSIRGYVLDKERQHLLRRDGWKSTIMCLMQLWWKDQI